MDSVSHNALQPAVCVWTGHVTLLSAVIGAFIDALCNFWCVWGVMSSVLSSCCDSILNKTCRHHHQSAEPLFTSLFLKCEGLNHILLTVTNRNQFPWFMFCCCSVMICCLIVAVRYIYVNEHWGWHTLLLSCGWIKDTSSLHRIQPVLWRYLLNTGLLTGAGI